MKKSLRIVGACAVLLAAGSALAQGAGTGTNACTGTNEYYHNYSQSYSNHWLYTNSGSGPWYSDTSRWTNVAPAKIWTNQARVLARGEKLRAGGPVTPAEVQALAQQFQQDREAFIARQSALKEQLASVPDQERQRLRDQLRDQMQDWKNQQSRLRDQLQDQADRLRDQLRSHDRLMDRVSNPGTTPTPGAAATGPRGR